MNVRRNILLLLMLAACLGCTYSQTPVTTPTPSDDEVVKIRTDLVQIDVTVTDRDDHPIKGLRAEDFEIFQNGKKQPISNFAFISSSTTTNTAAQAPATSTPKGVAVLPPPMAIRTAAVHRTIALVVDDLSLSWTSTLSVQHALRKFVDNEMQPGDLVAIIRTGAGIGALQQFTNDKRQLYAAIERVKYNSLGSGHVAAFAPLEGKNEIENSPQFAGLDAQNQAMEDFKSSIMATGTLGALNFILRGMAELPGRKSIILFSDGLALFTKDANGDRDSTRVYDAMRRLVERANRASVVINTIDSRGLVVTSLTAADNGRGRNAAQLTNIESQRAQQIADTQEGLLYLAKETGGRTVRNNNDIAGGVRSIVDDQSYYLIGYVPDDETFEPGIGGIAKYNNLSVKVNRPGVLVRYRQGFIGSPDSGRTSPAVPIGKKLEYALTSPFALSEITLRLNALFHYTQKDGSYIRNILHIRGADLTASDAPNGKKNIAFDVLAMTLGDNGNPIQQLSKGFSVDLTKEQYAEIARTGFVYDFVFPIKKSGAYQMRIAIRDRKTQKVGSANQFVDVPDLGKHRLTLSGIAVEAVPAKSWANKNAVKTDGTALADTALRTFKRGSVLHYGFAVYNAADAKADLVSVVRLYREGQLVFDGKETPIAHSPGSKVVPYDAAMMLGTDLIPGDYVLEVNVVDRSRSGSGSRSTEYVQFELVD